MGSALTGSEARGWWPLQPLTGRCACPADHESILIALVVISLFLLPALMLSIYYWYHQENSLLNRWLKEMRHRSHGACRCVGHPKPALPSPHWGLGLSHPAWQGCGELVLHRPCSGV